jgi:hypothetical protein
MEVEIKRPKKAKDDSQNLIKEFTLLESFPRLVASGVVGKFLASKYPKEKQRQNGHRLKSQCTMDLDKTNAMNSRKTVDKFTHRQSDIMPTQ